MDADSVRTSLDVDGFLQIPDFLSEDELLGLDESALLNNSESAAGVRNLCYRCEKSLALSNSHKVRDLVEKALGKEGRLVRSILFSKSPKANWNVLWHQDLAIPVKAKFDIEGFSAWSDKEGVLHVQPPEEILNAMVTLRIHLDMTDESNGALEVSPTSHQMGRVPAHRAGELVKENRVVCCTADRGDALLMKPLLLHASKKATCDRPRRVLHFEFAGTDLPPPLEWAQC